MNAAATDILAAVRALGGEVKPSNPGRLRVIAPAPLPNELIQQLRAFKPDLLALLSSSEPQTESRDSAEEERGDTSVPRTWTEGYARLDPNNAPADVPPARWMRFIDDFGRFLGGEWARQAAALGWRPLDLFGCDRERPFARVDRAGLLWLLNGRKLVAFTADTATIETPTGSYQTYRRGWVEHGEVMLAWKLGSTCVYCGRGQLLRDPLLDAAVDGDMFCAHRTCLDLEWQSWQRDPSKARSFYRPE
jgi:hypothetical protein